LMMWESTILNSKGTTKSQVLFDMNQFKKTFSFTSLGSFNINSPQYGIMGINGTTSDYEFTLKLTQLSLVKLTGYGRLGLGNFRLWDNGTTTVIEDPRVDTDISFDLDAKNKAVSLLSNGILNINNVSLNSTNFHTRSIGLTGVPHELVIAKDVFNLKQVTEVTGTGTIRSGDSRNALKFNTSSKISITHKDLVDLTMNGRTQLFHAVDLTSANLEATTTTPSQARNDFVASGPSFYVEIDFKNGNTRSQGADNLHSVCTLVDTSMTTTNKGASLIFDNFLRTCKLNLFGASASNLLALSSRMQWSMNTSDPATSIEIHYDRIQGVHFCNASKFAGISTIYKAVDLKSVTISGTSTPSTSYSRSTFGLYDFATVTHDAITLRSSGKDAGWYALVEGRDDSGLLHSSLNMVNKSIKIESNHMTKESVRIDGKDNTLLIQNATFANGWTRIVINSTDLATIGDLIFTVRNGTTLLTEIEPGLVGGRSRLYQNASSASNSLLFHTTRIKGIVNSDLQQASAFNAKFNPIAKRQLEVNSTAQTNTLTFNASSNGDFVLSGAKKIQSRGETQDGTFQLSSTQLKASTIWASFNALEELLISMDGGSFLSYSFDEPVHKYRLSINATTQNDIKLWAKNHSFDINDIYSVDMSLKEGKSLTTMSQMPFACIPNEDFDCVVLPTTLVLSPENVLSISNSTMKDLSLRSKTETTSVGVDQTGTFDTVVDLVSGALSAEGTGSTTYALVANPQGKIETVSDEFDRASLLPIKTSLNASQGEMRLFIHDPETTATFVVAGVFRFVSKGNNTLVDFSMDADLFLRGKGTTNATFTLWSPNQQLKRQEKETLRTISIDNHSDIFVVTSFLPVNIDFQDDMELTALAVNIFDGQNIVVFTGPLTPTFNFSSAAWGNVTSYTPFNIDVPNSVSFNAQNAMVHPKEDEEQTCIQPRLICTRPQWNELAIDRLTQIPCNSRIYTLPNATCHDIQSVELETNGMPWVCFVEDTNNETGWTILINPEKWVPYNHTSTPLKNLVIATFSIHTFILVVSYVFFNSIVIEGWLAVVITSFLTRATPQYGWSVNVLSIVNAARFIVIDWWTAYSGGAGICTNDLSNMIAGWLMIGLTALCIGIALTKHFLLKKHDPPQKLEYVVEFLLRFLPALALFWVALPAIAHSYIPDSSTAYTGFILAAIFVSIIVMSMYFGYFSTEKPIWMCTPPGWEGISLWDKNKATLAFLVFLVFRCLLPGLMGHVYLNTEGAPTISVAIILIFFTSIMPVVKEYLLARQNRIVAEEQPSVKPPTEDEDIVEYKLPSPKQDHIMWGVTGFVSLLYFCFGTLFVVRYHFYPYTSELSFTGIWIFWAIIVSWCFPILDAVKYYLAYSAQEDKANEYELQTKIKYQQF